MSLVVKEEPVWEVPCESEQDGILDVKIVKVEVGIEPEPQESVVNQESVKQEPQWMKREEAVVVKQEPSDSEEGSAEAPSLQLHEVTQPEVPQPTSTSPKTEIICVNENGTNYQHTQCVVKPVTKHKCETCSKEFTRINNLRAHLQTHTRKQAYCTICNREFSRQSNLTTHNKRIHSGNRPYSCEVCNKSFKESYVLNRHKRIHTGEKPYACEICGRTFAVPNHLKEHKRVHSEDKPFTCEICNKQFKHKYTLKCHIIYHTGQKPHNCEVCSKTFIRSTDLKEHARSHEEGKPYACERCKAEFSRKDSYFRHVKRLACRGSGRPVKDKD